MKFIIALSILLTSCGYFKRKHEEAKTINPLEQLHEKTILYRSLNKNVGDAHGYIGGKCDSGGFTSLCKVGGGCGRADIFASESKTEPGRWYRNPDQNCFPSESRTDDSNDQALMRLIYFVSIDHKEAAKREKDYLEKNSWVLGRHDGSGEGVSATQFAYFNALIDWVGGKSLTQTTDEIGILTGYRGHLQVLSILLNGMIHGAINDIEMSILRKQADRQPRNALYHAALHKYTDGVQDQALSILLDEKLFPADRLPQSSDRCEEYLFQRDDEPRDWAPCEDGKTHSGTDLMFTAYVLGVR